MEARIGRGCGKVAQEQRLFLRAVIGVGFTQCMGINTQALHVGFGYFPCCLPTLAITFNGIVRCPESKATQRMLEVADCRHRYRVDHLLVKLRIAFGWCQPILGQQIGLIEVNRRVEAFTGRVEIDHFQVLANRAGLQDILLCFRIKLPAYLHRYRIDHGVF